MKLKTAWIVLTASLISILASAQTAPLTLNTSSLPVAAAGIPYKTQLVAAGGREPYTWSVREGELPPGLQLDEKSGTLFGVPATPGEFHFTVALADSSVPPNQVERKYTLLVRAALTIRWIDPPRVVGEAIRGRMEVANGTGHSLDLTVIVLAVNSYGKAFALGYQHFTLAPQAKSPPIPFESTLPYGTYVVNADAVGEVKARGIIYRARMEAAAMSIQRP
jgi:Putative Ig domain